MFSLTVPYTLCDVVSPYRFSYTSPKEFTCFAPTPCAIVPVGAIVSLHLKAIKRISNVVISAPALIPIAKPAPVLNGGYHILCLENPGLLGLYSPAAPPVAHNTFLALIS